MTVFNPSSSGSQTPWTSDIDGGGFNLFNVNTITADNLHLTGYIVDGTPRPSADTSSRILYDSTVGLQPSLKWDTRQLIASDNDIAIDWSGTLAFFSASGIDVNSNMYFFSTGAYGLNHLDVTNNNGDINFDTFHGITGASYVQTYSLTNGTIGDGEIHIGNDLIPSGTYTLGNSLNPWIAIFSNFFNSDMYHSANDSAQMNYNSGITAWEFNTNVKVDGHATVGGLDDTATQFTILPNALSATMPLMDVYDIGGNTMFELTGDGTPNEGMYGTGMITWQGIDDMTGAGSGSGVGIFSGAGFSNSSGNTTTAGGTFQFSSGAGGSFAGSTSSGTVIASPGGGFFMTAGGAGFASMGGTGTAKGGFGGQFSFQSGTGGNSIVNGATTKSLGGGGGAFSFTSGSGGTANGAGSSGNAVGGNGGVLTFTASMGGAAFSSTGNNTGGNAGMINFTGMQGGSGQNGNIAKGGNGSSLNFTAGQGGVASFGSTNTTGNGGTLTFKAGLAGVGGTGGIDGSILFKDASNTTQINLSTGVLGFFGATPVAQQGATIDLGVALSNLGLRVAGTAYPITTSGAVSVGSFTMTSAEFQSITNKVFSNSPYTVASTDRNIVYDATSGASTVNLPAATGSGRVLDISKKDSINLVTVTPNGADTIEGAATYVLSVQYQDITLLDSASGLWLIK